jgi:hypothetical protein
MPRPWSLRAARAHLARIVLVLYALVLAVPVVHAQAEVDRGATAHVESEQSSCTDHDPLSCPVCRMGTSPVPLGTAAVAPIAAETDTDVEPSQPSVPPAAAVHITVGARAPPLH